MKKLKNPELFEEVSKYCVPVNSDDVELQNCPFTHEYINSPISSPSLNLTPETQPTPIIMLSLPSTTESVTQSSPHEQFETPPENNNSSQPYFSGSDDPKPSDPVNHDTNTVADLANDDDELGFTNMGGDFEEEMRKKVRVSEEDLDEKEGLLIEIDQTQEVDTEIVMECEDKLEAGKQNERHSDSESSNLKLSERCHEEDDEGEVREHGDNESMNVHKNEKLKGVVAGDDGGRGMESMNIDENEKFNGVGVKEMHSNGIAESICNGGGGGSVEGRRELPASMMRRDKNIGLMEVIGKAASTGKFKDLMEVASRVLGGEDADENNGDFFETAIRRGVTFPRPRWWPPEGFDD